MSFDAVTHSFKCSTTNVKSKSEFMRVIPPKNIVLGMNQW